MKKLLAIASLAVLLAAPAAFAPRADAQQAPDETFNFDDEVLTGDLVRPDGELLNVRRRGRRASLIRVRTQFVAEMLKSVENL